MADGKGRGEITYHIFSYMSHHLLHITSSLTYHIISYVSQHAGDVLPFIMRVIIPYMYALYAPLLFYPGLFFYSKRTHSIVREHCLQ